MSPWTLEYRTPNLDVWQRAVPSTREWARTSARCASHAAFPRRHELGYDRTYLAGIERGERNLSLDTLSKLAEQLGVDPLELLSD